MDKPIFIHIPKTGGTSINCELNQTEWQTQPDFYYRHIDYKSKKSNSDDIFLTENYNKYKRYDIFMMLRDPIQRLSSEYYFLRTRKEFMELLPRQPRSFYEYCKFKNTQNGMIKFILGHRIFSNPILLETDLNNLLEQMDNLNIRVGIFEKYENSLNYFEQTIPQIKWNNTIQKKRITIDKPHQIELTSEQIEEIKMANDLDYKLYAYAVNKLAHFLEGKSLKNYELIGTKYDYIEMYTRRFVLIETRLSKEGLRFLATNKTFFSELNLQLRKKNLVGRNYVENWNSLFTDALKKSTNDLDFHNSLDQIILNENDPLEISFGIANLLNIYLEKTQILIKK